MSRRPITTAEIAASTTPSGGYAAKQFRAWGISYPPKRGWQKRLLRTGVPSSCPYPPGFDVALVPDELVPTNPALSFGPQPEPVVMPGDALEIFTDGSCDPNPGPGGWGFVVYRGAAEMHSAFGGEVASTNNRQELQAIIQALRWLDPKRAAILTSDSQYCVRGCLEWRHGWRKKNWTRGRAELANADLWQALDALLDSRFVEIQWTRGHVGTVGNERADELAGEGRQSVLGDVHCVRASPGRRPSAVAKSEQRQAGPVLIKRSRRQEDVAKHHYGLGTLGPASEVRHIDAATYRRDEK